MPRNGSGTFTVPLTYTPNTLASAADVNTNFADVASGLTGSLPRDGQAGMSGQLKAADGALATPGISFEQDQDTGIRRSAANKFRMVCGGVDIAEFSETGLTLIAGELAALGLTPVGIGTDYWGTSAPTGWLFAYGQAVSRTTYAALFTVFGTTYGAGDGSTTFNLPDKRGRASFGKDNMGGTAANRITNQSGGWVGSTLGAAGGAQTHTLTAAELAAHTHPTTVNLNDPGHQHSLAQGALADQAFVGGGSSTASQAAVNTNGAQTGITVSVSVNANTGGGAHNNLPPGITCNYIIFAGA
jgi:microcystin-dependent protein